LQAKA